MAETTTVDAAELRQALRDLVHNADADAHLTLAWRGGGGDYRVEYVEIENGLGDEFLGHAREAVDDLLDNRAEVPYDPEWPLKESEYFALTAEQIPGGELFADLQDFLDLERFERRALKKPRLYTVAVQTADGTALFGKRMAYLKQLGRKKGNFSAIWDGSTFSELQATVATFSTHFDWVLWEDILYILDAKNFHAEFRDQKALREAVREHVEKICEHIDIVGAKEFIERCQSTVSMASKLRSVAEHGIWDEPIDSLKAYAAERGIEVEWDGDSLVFDGSIEHQFAILKLLDEDRTHGPVSGRTYDSAAKQAVELPTKD